MAATAGELFKSNLPKRGRPCEIKQREGERERERERERRTRV